MVLNVGFLLLWAAFNTSQCLSGEVLRANDFGNLGFYSLSVQYFFCVFGCFLATPMVTKTGFRVSLFVGSITYSMQVATYILPAYRSENLDSEAWYLQKGFISGVILLVAAINGIGSVTLWIACGTYISECANESNKGLYNCIFWIFLESSSIFGNLMGAYVIAD